MGQGVEERIGGGIVRLAGRTDQGTRHGTEQHEMIQGPVPGQLVQVPGGIGLGSQTSLEPFGSLLEQYTVIQHSGTVEDTRQRRQPLVFDFLEETAHLAAL